MPGNKSKLTAVLLLTLGTAFWGMTFVVVKEGVNIIDVYLFLSLRFLIAACLLGILFYKRLVRINRRLIKYGFFLSIPLGLGYITQTIGLKYILASRAAFITALSVVIVPVLSAFVARKFPQPKTFVAVLSAVSGLYLITVFQSTGLFVGNLWVVLCAVFFAVYIVMVGRISSMFEPMALTFVQLVVIGIATGLIGVFKSEFYIPRNYAVWKDIGFTAVFATAFVYAVQNKYQKYISDTQAAIIYSLEPVFAALTAYFYSDEGFGLKTIIGGLLILVGVLMSGEKAEQSK